MKNARKITILPLLLLLFLSACGAGESLPEIDGGAGTGVAAVYYEDGNVSLVAEEKLTAADKKDAVGVIYDAPELITAVCDEAEGYLTAGDRVLILYLDGFGWEIFQNALDDGIIPNMAALAARRAAAMYPTITPVNYAAMTTGETPAVNGVTARGIHSLSCPSIFDYAASLGLTSFIAEGDAQILAFSQSQELHVDLDGDGSNDGETVETALAQAAGDVSLLFVHLHGIDDTSHAFGPSSAELRDKLIETDGYVGKLLAAWPGRVMITADHGQHENDGTGDPEYADKKGSHGSFLPSDIFIPILTN